MIGRSIFYNPKSLINFDYQTCKLIVNANDSMIKRFILIHLRTLQITLFIFFKGLVREAYSGIWWFSFGDLVASLTEKAKRVLSLCCAAWVFDIKEPIDELEDREDLNG